MASVRVPITIRPVELVAVSDTALDWSGAEVPSDVVVELLHAPQRPGLAPDVYVCRALTASEKMQINKRAEGESGSAFAPILLLSIGLMAIVLGSGKRIETRREIFDLIEGGGIDDDILMALARWIHHASRGDDAGRGFLDSSAHH